MEFSEIESMIMEGLAVTTILAGIPLCASLLVGLLLSVLQAATQIQEQTLTFVPKLAAVALILWLLGAWMTNEMVDFSTSLLNQMAHLARAG